MVPTVKVACWPNCFLRALTSEINSVINSSTELLLHDLNTLFTFILCPFRVVHLYLYHVVVRPQYPAMIQRRTEFEIIVPLCEMVSDKSLWEHVSLLAGPLPRNA